MEEEFQKGYIWRPSFLFDADFDNIRPVHNVETNHYCLSQQQMRDMYKRLGGLDTSLVLLLILQVCNPLPIWWVKEMKRMRRGTRRYLSEEQMQSGSLMALPHTWESSIR